jgi:hypothetical protein
MNIIVQTFNEESTRLPKIDEIRKFTSFQGEYSRSVDEIVSGYDLRRKYVEHSFPILSDELMKSFSSYLSSYSHVAELACGEGWLTFWLNKYSPGCVSECVDNMSWEKHKDHLDFVIDDCAVNYVKNNPSVDLFILSWPYMSSLAFDVWSEMRKGQTLLYIGESWGGCTANEEFFEATRGHRIDHDINYFVSFEGINDDIEVYRKN